MVLAHEERPYRFAQTWCVLAPAGEVHEGDVIEVWTKNSGVVDRHVVCVHSTKSGRTDLVFVAGD